MKRKVGKVLLVLVAVVVFGSLFVQCKGNKQDAVSSASQSENAKYNHVITIKDEHDAVISISLADMEKYHGHVCPCVAATFRALKIGISELWGNKIPERGDFVVVSALPSDGAEDVFEFVTRVRTRAGGKNFSIKLPEGMKKTDFSVKKYAYTITRKSTGKTVVVKLKTGIVPDGMFGLQKKHKVEKNASPEEEKKFRELKKKFKNKLLTLSDKELFSVEKK